MFKNFLKIAVRNFRKQGGYSFINIAGLALGMACFLLIVFYVQFEKSYDNFHENGRNIYMVVRENTREDRTREKAVTGAPLAPLLLQEFPSITHAVRFTRFEDELIGYGEKRFHERRFFFADASMFDVFTFTLLKGDPSTALKNPFSVVLTQETAVKYFGDEDPINKVLHYNLDGRKHDFIVTGILDDIPRNSHIEFDFVGSYGSLRTILGEFFMTKHWDSPTWTYIQLREGYPAENLEELLPAFTDKHVDKWTFSSVSHSLLPLREVYFNSPDAAISSRGDRLFSYLLTVISIFILLIACVNFMNLATARSASRMKEIGLRKVVGAHRPQLIRQFIGESLLYSFLALLLALVLVELLLPLFNSFTGRNLVLDFSGNIGYAITMVLTVLIVGLLTGSYPAFHLSSFKPVAVLSGKARKGSASERLRKVLVVGQFVISIALIITSIGVYRQIQYLRNKKLGFNENHVVTIQIRDRDVRDKYDLLKNQWLQSPLVKGVTASSILPSVTYANGIQMKARDIENIGMSIIYVDYDYLETLQIDVVEGRDFSKDIATDARGGLLMNQAALEELGWESAVGEKIELFLQLDRIIPMYQTTLIGIVEDYNYHSLRSQLGSILLKIEPFRFRHIMIRIDGQHALEALRYIEETWDAFHFDQPFEFTFLDAEIDNVYRSYSNFGGMIRNATFIAVFIACLGLFGLSSFAVEKRTKEVGIRKVLGASAGGVVLLFTREFAKCVLVANVIAWPIAYYVTNHWMQNFAYRAGIQIWMFILAAVVALMIALATVSFQAIRAATANPTHALRYE